MDAAAAIEKLKEALTNFKSRKVIMLAFGIVMALVTFMQKSIGLSIGAGGAVTGLIVIMTYLFGEFKIDMARMRTQVFQDKKWGDPAFWASALGALLPVISDTLGIKFLVEAANTIITLLLGLVFKQRLKKA